MSGTENPFQSNTTPENDSAGQAGGSRSVVRNTLSTGSQTTVINATEAVSNDNDPPTLTLRLTNTNDPNETETGEKSKPKKLARKQVSWTQETVDNEHMGRKKSKCCCVYVKPKTFGESDTESDENDEDDCKNCSGHTKSDPKKNLDS